MLSSRLLTQFINRNSRRLAQKQNSPSSPIIFSAQTLQFIPFLQGLASMDLTHAFVDGSYQPDKPMTRAQYAALVAIAFNPFPKIPALDFTDVPKDFWAYSAIQIAASGGFVGGFSGSHFRPVQSVQRLQVIVSLINGLGLPAVNRDVLEVYSDRHTIPDYAQTAVATATQ